ncbi:hypothetical protein NPIL_241371 [Nephila pilipes]|uniref:RNase H type-1 domain-containing protein n=1 Tax=Nephila pilipes TaxID=299642 RepID=A0A8X6QPC7_NEPPI|nr:hypothetical protein NPIL_241371 [Nephila pilipes]
MSAVHRTIGGANACGFESRARSNNQESLRVQRCRFPLKEFKGKVSFQWVPSYCGLRGNETADFVLAKRGTVYLQKSCRHLLLYFVNWVSREFLSNHFILQLLLLMMISHGVCPVDPTGSWTRPLLLLWLCLSF